MMTPRDTRTGGVLEAMILPALARGGYAYQTQIKIGTRPNGRAHRVDAIAEKNGERILVSLKWQQVGGTAEQKVPFEVMCLATEVHSGAFQKAYLVLGGDGWTLREFYVSGDLEQHLVHGDKVVVMTLERFVAVANQGKL
ncbi:MAG: PD-(D/E)XK nuclease superfamily protein [Candidatus Acidiferrales bacterium]